MIDHPRLARSILDDCLPAWSRGLAARVQDWIGSVLGARTQRTRAPGIAHRVPVRVVSTARIEEVIDIPMAPHRRRLNHICFPGLVIDRQRYSGTGEAKTLNREPLDKDVSGNIAAVPIILPVQIEGAVAVAEDVRIYGAPKCLIMLIGVELTDGLPSGPR